MSVLIDIIGAFIIGSIMFVMIFSNMGNVNQAHYEKALSTNVQTNVVTLARILEYDILKIGYHIKNDAIQYADSVRMEFKADLKNDGNVVSVQYNLGNLITSTRNPKDRKFIRQVSGEPSIEANLGLTSMQFTYYDTLGRQLQTPITTPVRLDSIKSINVKLWLESPEPVYSMTTGDSSYQTVFWEKTMYPRNL
ncbi:MAG: hypothetical protein QME52_06000 [Bacteroidota bacterium]|nr:hypothetical protein [Bacteroidota bacterium]